jgi:hypothetical protein
LNAQYEAEIAKFAMKPPKEVQVISEEEKQADYYKGFRSAVVLAWVFCNFALGAVVLSAAGLETFDKTSSSSDSQDATQSERSMIYMEVVLWSVAGLSMFKFVGAMWYLVVRMVSPFPFSISFLPLKHTNFPFSSSAVFDLAIFQHNDCSSALPCALQQMPCYAMFSYIHRVDSHSSELESTNFRIHDHGGPGLVCNGVLKWI